MKLDRINAAAQIELPKTNPLRRSQRVSKRSALLPERKRMSETMTVRTGRNVEFRLLHCNRNTSAYATALRVNVERFEFRPSDWFCVYRGRLSFSGAIHSRRNRYLSWETFGVRSLVHSNRCTDAVPGRAARVLPP